MVWGNDLRRSWQEKAVMLAVIVLPAVATAYAMVHLLLTHQITWKEPVLFFVSYWLTGFGITIGYHRLLTHRSFDANPVVRFLFIMFGVMAFEGSPQSWTALHLMHHKHADHDDDPHSPVHGFWHAHLGWMISSFNESRERYGKWMDKDKLVQFMNNTTLVWMALRLLIPYWIDGVQGLIWGGLVSIFWTHHSTWSVNSAAHSFGRRDFKTEDESTNLWWVGLIALGEGWHNGHHAYPWSARHGLLPRQFDASYQIIMFLKRLGLVWNVKEPTPEEIAARRARDQQGIESVAEPTQKDPSGVLVYP